MLAKRQHLSELLEARVRADGLNLSELISSTSAIVVFGSQAACVSSVESDVDALCIGRGRRHKSSLLDILWASEREVNSDMWLASELASHIDEYGVIIRGECTWKGKAVVGSRALDRKVTRVRRLFENAQQNWSDLMPPFRQRYQKTIRRELQRFDFLSARAAVPPTPVLDLQWKKGVRPSIDVLSEFGSASALWSFLEKGWEADGLSSASDFGSEGESNPSSGL